MTWYVTFAVSTNTLINILIIAMGIGICVLSMIQVGMAVHTQKEVRRGFMLYFLSLTVYLISNLLTQLFDDWDGSRVRPLMQVCVYTEFVAAGFMAFFMSMLVVYVARTGKDEKRYSTILAALMALHVILITVNLSTGFIYYLDQGNMYHRGPGYLTCNLAPLCMMILDTVLLVRFGKNINRRVRTALWVYLIAPALTIFIQWLVYGIQFIVIATVGAGIYMFFVFLQDQNEHFLKQQAETSRIETELGMAASIQTDMLPNIFPAFPDRRDFDIYASMNPAKEVGGDFYDFFLIDDDHLCLIMADVSGKGVPAALFMMSSMIMLENSGMAGKSPSEIIRDTNEAICANNREQMFVTVWLGILELSSGKLISVNAGHEHPALRKSSGSFELIENKHDFVVGGMAGMKYREHVIQLEPGSKLFLYTDGVPEATDTDNEMFGSGRMLDALNSDPDASPQELLEAVHRAVNDFVGEAQQFDDLTMMCLEYTGR